MRARPTALALTVAALTGAAATLAGPAPSSADTGHGSSNCAYNVFRVKHHATIYATEKGKKATLTRALLSKDAGDEVVGLNVDRVPPHTYVLLPDGMTNPKTGGDVGLMKDKWLEYLYTYGCE